MAFVSSAEPKAVPRNVRETTLLQQTLARLEGLETAAATIICNDEHRFMVAEQLRQQGIKGASIPLEPVGRNTAPAIALAAIKVRNEGGDPLLLVLTADHYIENEQAFWEAVERATPLAEQSKLVTFGVVPECAETGYGNVQRGTEGEAAGFQVARFVEKPSFAKAEEYLANGDYYWNSGIFLLRASVYLNALEQFQPDILIACEQAVTEGKEELDFVSVGEALFATCADESIDYAVMGKLLKR